MRFTTPIAGNRKVLAATNGRENSASGAGILPAASPRNFPHRQACHLWTSACTNAFVKKHYHPLNWDWPGAPLLGMEKFIRADKEIHDLFANQSATWILAPNSETHTLKASKSNSHGSFDDDKATVKGSLARIIGSSATGAAPFEFTASASSSKDRRSHLRQSGS